MSDRVNEFDADAWGSVFDAMTKEREESESAEAVSARQAAEMVTKMLEDMQENFSCMSSARWTRWKAIVSVARFLDGVQRSDPIIGSGRVP